MMNYQSTFLEEVDMLTHFCPSPDIQLKSHFNFQSNAKAIFFAEIFLGFISPAIEYQVWGKV